MKLTSPHDSHVLEQGQDLEIVVEEDHLPIYYLDTPPSDYELSDTPYSSQKPGDSFSKTFENIEESFTKEYASAPQLQ